MHVAMLFYFLVLFFFLVSFAQYLLVFVCKPFFCIFYLFLLLQDTKTITITRNIFFTDALTIPLSLPFPFPTNTHVMTLHNTTHNRTRLVSKALRQELKQFNIITYKLKMHVSYRNLSSKKHLPRISKIWLAFYFSI